MGSVRGSGHDQLRTMSDGTAPDAEVIAAANEANMAMVFTGVRHFRH